MGAWGDSLVQPTDGWADQTRKWIRANYPKYITTWLNQAVGGNWTWSNNLRSPVELLASSKDIVLCVFRPPDPGHETEAGEALLRRIWTANPTARIIAPIMPGTTDYVNVDAKSAQMLAAEALFTYYGGVLIDYRQAVIDLIALGDPIGKYIADNIHPTAVGHTLCASMIKAYIASHEEWAFNPEDHSTLPARLYDNGDYELPPTRVNGTAYTSRTGTWTDTGTRTESDEADATITFEAVTCKSFGLYSAGTANATADVSIDGGGWILDRDISHNGYAIGARAEYDITIRVRAGTPVRIDEFWAI